MGKKLLFQRIQNKHEIPFHRSNDMMHIKLDEHFFLVIRLDKFSSREKKKMAVCCVIRHSVGGPCQSADHYTSTNTGWSQSYFTYTISAIGAKPIQWEIFLLRHVMLSLILFRGGISFWWPGRLQCNNEISPMWLSLV